MRISRPHLPLGFLGKNRVYANDHGLRLFGYLCHHETQIQSLYLVLLGVSEDRVHRMLVNADMGFDNPLAGGLKLS